MKPIYDYDGETGVETQAAWELSFAELDALRKAVRAAHGVRGLVGDCMCVECKALWRVLKDALDALPAGLLDTESEKPT